MATPKDLGRPAPSIINMEPQTDVTFVQDISGQDNPQEV